VVHNTIDVARLCALSSAFGKPRNRPHLSQPIFQLSQSFAMSADPTGDGDLFSLLDELAESGSKAEALNLSVSWSLPATRV